MPAVPADTPVRWTRRRGRIWAITAGGILLLLAFDSAVLRVFFLYGRLVRQAVPFACLAAGFAFYRLFVVRGPSPRVVAAIAALWVLQVAYNFSAPLRQVFPQELRLQLVRYATNMSYAWSIEGPPSEVPEWDARYVALNMRGYIWPVLGPKEVPAGRVILSFPHPMEYAPYRYEGLSPVERNILERMDISMRLIDTHAAP